MRKSFNKSLNETYSVLEPTIYENNGQDAFRCQRNSLQMQNA